MTHDLTPDPDESNTRSVAAGTEGTSRARRPQSSPTRRRLPPRLTEARIRSIAVKVAKGVPQQAAAASLGIPPRTLQHWLAAGREQGAAERTEGEGRLYFELAEAVDEAKAKFHAKAAGVVLEHAKKDPRSAMFVLERRFPEDWADQGKGGTTVNVNVMGSPEWREALQRIADVLREKHPEALRTLAAEFGYAPEQPRELGPA